MIKTTFQYRVGGHLINVAAVAKKVTEYGAERLNLSFSDESGDEYTHMMDHETMSEVEEQAIEALQDAQNEMYLD